MSSDGAPETTRGRPWRRREATLLAIAVVAALFLLFFETQMPPFTSGQSLGQNVVVFLLININIVLIVLVVFLIGRNIVKLVIERRQRVLGSHLRTRLVLGFVAVAITPAVLLFIVATGFIRSSIESWFSLQVEGALEGSLDMAEIYTRESMAAALHEAHELSRQLGRSRRALSQEAPLLAEKQREYAAASIRVFDPQGRAVSAAKAEGLSPELGLAPSAAFVAEALRQPERTDVVSGEDGEILRAATRIVDAKGAVRGLVVVDEIIPRSVERRAEEIAESYRQYKQLRLLRRPLINSYVLALLVTSLVVVFGGTWIGFAIARSLTEPIQRLAEGTRRVAEGHYDEQIPLDSGSDEIATLVTGFNRMTANLRTTHTALAERRQALETILANIAGGVVSIDRQARIETVNAAARHMLAIEEDAVGMPFRQWFSSPRFGAIRDLLSELDKRAQQGIWDKLPPQRLSIEHEDGAVEILATGVALRNAEGEAIGALLFFEDVTEILKVQRMEAWREVARRIAHEIKNPLTPIQLSAQRLRKRYAGELSGSSGAVLDECTRTIIAEVDVLKSLVSEFANFARLPAGAHVPTDLNDLVEEALVLFREAHRRVGFRFDRDESVPQLDLDRNGIRRVLTNMLDNAVAAIEAGAGVAGAGGATAAATATASSDGDGGDGGEPVIGHVWLATRLDSARGLVRLEIADDGVGMTAEVKARLFEPYFSTKAQGTGLGLAIASAVIADHRAFIRVRDNPPKGSRFVIEFPLGRRGEGYVATT